MDAADGAICVMCNFIVNLMCKFTTSKYSRRMHYYYYYFIRKNRNFLMLK